MADTKETALLAELHAPVDPMVGQLLQGKYRIVRKLGEGGMGDVYEAENQLIGKRVAIKVLHAQYAADAEVVARFKQEARAATAVGNEHIIDVLDLGELPDGAPFIVMEMLKGIEFGDLIDRDGPLDVDHAVRIVRQTCDALAAAHNKGIVHRDMKPENIFLASRTNNPEFVKVLDFGISKVRPDIGQMRTTATRTGVAMGTPHYMSPEQAQGLRETDHRTDIYAVGVILYEALCKTVPFAGDSIALVLAQILKDEPGPMREHRPELPAELDAIVLKALEKDPNRRFQTATELSSALLPFTTAASAASSAEEPPSTTPALTQAPAAAPATPMSESIGSTQMFVDELKRKNRAPLWAGIAVVFMAAAIGVWFLALRGWGAEAETETAAAQAAAAPTDPTTAAKPIEAAVAEVRIKITVDPADAFIYVNGARFPSPMDSARPRSLDPVRIVLERPGYKPREAVVIFDQDRTLSFQLTPLTAVDAPATATTANDAASTPTTTAATKRKSRRRNNRSGSRQASLGTTASPTPKPPTSPPVSTKPAVKAKPDGIYRGRSGKLREDF